MKGSIGFLILVFLVAAMGVAAQDHRRYEFYGGYAISNYDNILDSIDDGIDSSIRLRGFNTSFTGNVSKYVGIKVDYSLTGKKETFVDSNLSLEAKYRNSQILGGVQFKDNRVDGPRWKPFAHVMAGVSNQRIETNGTLTTPGLITRFGESVTTNNFAMVFGGGLDLKVTDNVDIRLIQVDYNPVLFQERFVNRYFIPRKTQNNIRMSFGVVVH